MSARSPEFKRVASSPSSGAISFMIDGLINHRATKAADARCPAPILSSINQTVIRRRSIHSSFTASVIGRRYSSHATVRGRQLRVQSIRRAVSSMRTALRHADEDELHVDHDADRKDRPDIAVSHDLTAEFAAKADGGAGDAKRATRTK